MRTAVWAARASLTIADTSLRTAATICSLIVEASCRLIDSAVRHQSRLEAAAVSRIAVRTSAETARRMLIVSILAEDGDRGRSRALERSKAFMLAFAGGRRA
ncbi:hypothetical protein J2R78_005414 [Bradyrhizobium sp. USDA 4538]|uniref:hypothetical protein n=1 Tax=unclassified Bradyrhizobium TaxID=2631580 RepID=UPI00209F930F|nr:MULTISPECIES: hypothetical protein [unclassified Bradyrhizobium]MCP1842447.1 hypothetical protein [Bradyrhizobium sp. USDA 4538]MCP1903011.1 hypothetical protein [Bradyrhizobium sp. USDA 4537]MCP1991332.1 hypothetical protein [Bradyrhizobium sp. USDA 4539]